jgi:hypothetical protein
MHAPFEEPLAVFSKSRKGKFLNRTFSRKKPRRETAYVQLAQKFFSLFFF